MMNKEEVNSYLWYNAEYKVLICLNCQYCLTPDGIENHFWRVHQSIPIDVRKGLVEYSKGVMIAKATETHTPSIEIEAIEGLKVIKGVVCDSCGTGFGSVTTMENHCWKMHDWRKWKGLYHIEWIELNSLGRMWREQDLQTFYVNKECKYFRVKVRRDGRPVEAVVELILEKTRKVDEDRAKSNHTIEKNEGRGENSPWLERTGWKRMFAGKDMKNLSGYVNIDEGLEPELIEVKKSVERVIDSCMASVDDLDGRGWNEIRFWLRSHQEGQPHEKPLRKPVTELNKYKKVWTRLITFCWRTFELDEVGAEFLDCQRDGIRQLMDAICLQSADDRTVDELMLKLSIRLIKHSDFETEGSVIKYFAGIMGYNVREGRWKRPNHYTPIG
jgi:hypothetical protein